MHHFHKVKDQLKAAMYLVVSSAIIKIQFKVSQGEPKAKRVQNISVLVT